MFLFLYIDLFCTTHVWNSSYFHFLFTHLLVFLCIYLKICIITFAFLGISSFFYAAAATLSIYLFFYARSYIVFLRNTLKVNILIRFVSYCIEDLWIFSFSDACAYRSIHLCTFCIISISLNKIWQKERICQKEGRKIFSVNKIVHCVIDALPYFFFYLFAKFIIIMSYLFIYLFIYLFQLYFPSD